MTKEIEDEIRAALRDYADGGIITEEQRQRYDALLTYLLAQKFPDEEIQRISRGLVGFGPNED